MLAPPTLLREPPAMVPPGLGLVATDPGISPLWLYPDVLQAGAEPASGSINEEKCDLQFPLIGKALAVPRHKVIALGLRRGEGQGQGPLSLQCPSPSHAQLCPPLLLPLSQGNGELAWQEAGLQLPVASWP